MNEETRVSTCRWRFGLKNSDEEMNSDEGNEFRIGIQMREMNSEVEFR